MKIDNDAFRPARTDDDGLSEGEAWWAGPAYDAPGHGYTPVPDRQVRAAVRVVRASALPAFFGTRLAPAGRPTAGPGVEALLVAMLLVAREDRTMNVSEFHLLLRHRLSPAARSALGLDAYAPDGPTRPQVARLYRRLVTVMNTGPAGDDPDRTGTDGHRLVVDHVVGRLLEGTWLLLPRTVRRSSSGAVVHDSVHVPAGRADRPATKRDGTAKRGPRAGVTGCRDRRRLVRPPAGDGGLQRRVGLQVGR